MSGVGLLCSTSAADVASSIASSASSAARITRSSSGPAELASTTRRPRFLHARSKSGAPGSGFSRDQYTENRASWPVTSSPSLSSIPAWRQQRVEQLIRAHPDRAVNVVHRYVMAGLHERFPPGDGVQIVAVDQGPVDVEQDRV